MKKSFFGGVLLVILVLAGCARPYGEDTSGVSDDNNGSGVGFDDGTQATSGNIYGGAGGGRDSLGDFYEDPAYGVNVVGGPGATEKDRIVYFSFDSSKLDSRSIAVVQEHAKYLRNNPQTRVILEGHTDERGTREYNIGLSERRAYAVKRAFEQSGVDGRQIRVLSYGEERPAANCSTELCYAKNRRVVIVY